MYALDPAAGEIFNRGTKVKLQERPVQLLVALVEKHGEVVTREELRQKLWPDGTFVDFDHSISSCVNKLRTALNDSARHPRYIETVGRRGYRFVSPVTYSLPSEQIQSPLEESNPQSSHRVRSILAVLAAGVLALTLVAAGLMYRGSSSHSPHVIRTIAVLPLKNLSSDAEQEYFSEGLTDELITRLASLKGLRVISRTSVMRFKDSVASLPDIARQLKVDAIVEGSVSRSGDRIRVTAQLIDASNDQHIWAESYDRDQRDVLALQNDVALDIAQNINLSLSTGDRARLAAIRPVDQEAHDDYLRGRYHWKKRTSAELAIAVEYFEKAIRRDPSYARAYAGLADCYALMSGYTLRSQQEFMPKARAAAVKAIELDDKLADAHTSLALIAQNYDWDWATAEKEFRRAIELDPNYATAHHWYAEHLAFRGRFKESAAEIETARQLDPQSLIMAVDNAVFLVFARDYDRAIQQFKEVERVDPDFGRVLVVIIPLVEQGRFAEALATLQQHENAQDPVWMCAFRVYIHGRWGHRDQALHEYARLRAMTRSRQIDSAPFLLAASGLRDKELMMTWLQKGYAQHSAILIYLKVDPLYDQIRDDERFISLLRKVGLSS
jgi:TolB-like protein/DNA-binding winged helix-turn-helix (wHTH) protein/Tfp pilus assembly protein PilF